MDRGASGATVHGVAKSQTRLSEQARSYLRVACLKRHTGLRAI